MDLELLVERQALNESREGEKNGFDHRMPDIRGFCLSEEENISISSDFGWMETVGSSIETNKSALVWQYRDANSGFVFAHAKEMLDHLQSVLANEPAAVKGEQYIVEFKPQMIFMASSGTATVRVGSIGVETQVVATRTITDQEITTETRTITDQNMKLPIVAAATVTGSVVVETTITSIAKQYEITGPRESNIDEYW
ncbi:probable alpha,alpha-trehalose-phosphate synthase [UDP-forming] 7 [Tanacetum coccineum]